MKFEVKNITPGGIEQKERERKRKLRDNTVVIARERGEWGEVEENIGEINGDGWREKNIIPIGKKTPQTPPQYQLH